MEAPEESQGGPVAQTSDPSSTSSGGDFDSIAIRIQNHALIIAVACPTRTVEDRVSISLDSHGKLIDKTLGAQ
jgi:hypothetical protein